MTRLFCVRPKPEIRSSSSEEEVHSQNDDGNKNADLHRQAKEAVVAIKFFFRGL